ncbi:MAG: thiolase domain-containing protein [Thermoplasmata archaeon]|nr:thiolase domain-containing protein [Thermoplasmata archaeon]
MRKVAVVGIGMTPFGELWDMSLRSLGIEAGLNAMVDAGLSSDEIDALYVGNMSSGRFLGQEHIAAMISDQAGFTRRNLPAIRVEAGEASGALAFREAFLSVAAEIHDVVIVGGAEKMTDVSDAMAQEIFAASVDQEWESFFGATVPSLYAMMARRHMLEYGTTREQMAEVPVNGHRNAAKNPNAHFRNQITVDAVIGSGPVATPLGVLDCAPVSDGASAVVLAPLEIAKRMTDRPVMIAGSGTATDSISLHHRKTLSGIPATTIASRLAYKRSGLSAKHIDIAEVHDNYSISGIMAVEDLGFVPRGQGGPAFQEGRFSADGEIPINLSGGLKAQGQPLGAIGIAQVVEVVRQLRGEGGERQVGNPEVGLTQCVGGTGGTCVVHVLKVV